MEGGHCGGTSKRGRCRSRHQGNQTLTSMLLAFFHYSTTPTLLRVREEPSPEGHRFFFHRENRAECALLDACMLRFHTSMLPSGVSGFVHHALHVIIGWESLETRFKEGRNENIPSFHRPDFKIDEVHSGKTCAPSIPYESVNNIEDMSPEPRRRRRLEGLLVNSVHRGFNTQGDM